ncbi:MAG: hypothetical protein V4792_04615 [Pseudomonadota bacterium]
MTTATDHSLWDERAAHFDDWGTPLRPPAEDLALYAAFVERCFVATSTPVPTLLLGVTPELASTRWPVPLRLTAIDQSEPMVRRVWPGDVADQRRALVGDWMRFAPDETPSLVLTDGAPVFFADPQVLFERVRTLLAPDGAFVVRAFCAPPQRERVDDVLADARHGAIENFHLFKWRIAMALQEQAREGVAQQRVWSVIHAADIDFEALPQPGFSARAVSTLRFYREQAGTLHFPTRQAYSRMLRESFDRVESAHAGHCGGECFSVFLARKAR